MTGCPACYDLDHLNENCHFFENKPDKVAFSMGVAFRQSHSMEIQMKNIIMELKKRYGSKLKVAFHHSLERNKYIDPRITERDCQFADWLQRNDIPFKDISGSAKGLIDFYSDAQLHIGYRLHAHLFMCSTSKPSILIAEDGRGKAIKDVLGGIVLDGYETYQNTLLAKIVGKTRLVKLDRFKPNEHLFDQLVYSLENEENTNYHRCQSTRNQINHNYKIMEKFMAQLP